MNIRARRQIATLAAAMMTLLGMLVVLAPTARATTCPTLRLSSHGACVLTLQKRLAALHYDIGAADGRFGYRTYHAVVAFQKVNGLTRSGSVTSSVWSRLYHSTVIPRPRYARSGSALEVNLSRQVVYRIANGAIATIYDTSTGRPSLPTPASWSRPFHIWKKTYAGTTGYNDIEHYVQYFYPHSLLAFHAYGYVPAYPASHGCIRLYPASAAHLYARTYVGERVFTYY